MSTSQGPRGGRGRGRGGATSIQKGNRAGSVLKAGGRAAAPLTTTPRGPSTRQYKPPPTQSASHDPIKRSSPSPARGGRGGSPPRSSRISTSPPDQEARRNPGSRNVGGIVSRRMEDVYQRLKKSREQERKDAINNGVLADPDKPTLLANAITPVGTCQEMCPRFERAERIVQLMVDGCEKKTSPSGVREPCEDKMVKRFRRSAAGYDEQMPSDIRPPLVLQRTLDYLINEVVGGPQPLASVHKFVWDRTRGIRNDFSIQQVTKIEDLRIAIDCFERIARFHILSLHQLSRSDRDNGEFNHYQEREQLNNTFLSLMYYYDDSRHKLRSPNEAEFRAYCIIFEIQDQRPDLEDRAQQWPRSLLLDHRVQTALKLYAAAGNTSDDQGPLRSRTPFAVAQANTGGFWDLVQSPAVSYTMACVTEIYFNLVRRLALEAIWKAYKGKRAGPTKMEDWILADLTLALGFDSEDQTQSYVEEHGFLVAENDNDQAYIDLGSVLSKHLTDTTSRRKQVFSKHLVEVKRLSRTLPAVINGVTASQAHSRGLIEDPLAVEDASMSHRESLFLSGESDDEMDGFGKAKSSSELRNAKGSSINRSVLSTKPPRPSATSGTSQLSAAPTAAGPPFWKPKTSSSFQQDSPTFGKPSVGGPFATPPPSFGKPSSARTLHTPSLSAASDPTTTEDHALIEPTASTNSEAASNASTNLSKSNTLTSPSQPLTNNTNPIFHIQSKPSSDGLAEMKELTKPALPFPFSSRAPTPFGSTATSLFNFPKPPPGTASTVKDTTSSLDNIPKHTINQPRASAPATFEEQKTAQPTFTPTTQSPSILESKQEPQKQINPLFQFPAAEPNPSISPTNERQSYTQHSLPPKQHTAFVEIILAQKQDLSSSILPFTPSSSRPTPSVSTSKDTIGLFAHQNADLNLDKLSAPLVQSSQCPGDELTPSSNKDLASSYASNFLRSSTVTGKSTPTRLLASSDAFLLRDTNSYEARPAALHALSETLMLDDEGLLQQFIEYTIGPIVTASIQQVQEERSWQQARHCRVFLLSKKYLSAWKKTAWRLGLLRKGKERRKKFAESMRDLSQNARRLPNMDGILSVASNGRDASAEGSMPPPTRPFAKRNSLPAGIIHDVQQSEKAPNKRKRENQSLHTEHSPPRRSKVHHKRSRTVASVSDSNSMSGSIHITPNDNAYNTSRLSFGGKIDTTNTDYFRLKALGLDPDTPLIPMTGKKRMRDHAIIRSEKRSKQSPDQAFGKVQSEDPAVIQVNHQVGFQRTPQSKSTLQDEEDSDEALFARLREVRDAMSDSISWFQSERAKSKRTSSGDPGASLNESPEQNKLREFRTTSSRTEQRLRATGAHGLLPKAWASNPSWRDANGRITMSNTPVSRREALPTKGGEAIIPALDIGVTWSIGKMRSQGPTKQIGLTSRPDGPGSSVKDAIEL